MPRSTKAPMLFAVSAAFTGAAALCFAAATQSPPAAVSLIAGVVVAADSPTDVQVVEIAGHQGRIAVDNPARVDLLGVDVVLSCLPDPDVGGHRCTIADEAGA